MPESGQLDLMSGSFLICKPEYSKQRYNWFACPGQFHSQNTGGKTLY